MSKIIKNDNNDNLFSDKDIDIITPFKNNDPAFSDISLILKRYLALALAKEKDPVKIPSIIASIISIFDKDNKTEHSTIKEFRDELISSIKNNNRTVNKNDKHKSNKSSSNILQT